MDWLQQLLGGSSMGGMGGGSSLMDAARGGQQQMSIMQMLGMSPMDQYTAPIGPQQDGTPLPSNSTDPQMQQQARSSALAKLGSGLSRWGAGVSAASGPSRMPVDFGQALAGGTNAMEAGQGRDMDNELKQAQIGALGQKQRPDFEAQAQDALTKQKMSIPLSPQETAMLQAYDAMETSKMQTVTMPDGTVRQVPARRPVFSQITGQGPAAMGGSGQAPRPTVPKPTTAQPRFRGFI